MAAKARTDRLLDPKRVLGGAALLATRADSALQVGRIEAAHALYAKAAAMTEAAIVRRVTRADEQVMSLLMSNAATLWYKANDLKRAEDLASRLLASAPDAVKGNLRHVLFACWQAQTSVGENEYFTPIEMRLAGREVGFGTAPVDEVTRRQETIQALLWRASEFEAKVPYRSRGLPHPTIRAVAQAYAATPAPGSYHVVLKVRSPSTRVCAAIATSGSYRRGREDRASCRSRDALPWLELSPDHAGWQQPDRRQSTECAP